MLGLQAGTVWLAILALASGPACGRVGFDAALAGDGGDGGGDAIAAVDGAPAAVPAIVQVRSWANFASATAQTLPATRGGTLLAVAIDVNSSSDVVASVADNSGDIFVSANVASASPNNPGGAAVSEIWYAAVVAGGATTLTVTTAGGANLWDVTVLEIDGLRTTAPVDVKAAASSLPGTTSASNGVPLTTTGENSALVTLNAATGVIGLANGSLFQNIATGGNDNIAYLVGAHPIGSYEADWTCSAACGEYNVSAAAFFAR